MWRQWLTPDAVSPRVTAIAPEALTASGIQAVIVDLDNTLTPWNDRRCDPEVAGWLQRMQAAGLRVCIVSNNGPERVRGFLAAAGLDLPWIAHAGKPRRRAYQRALQCLGVTADGTAAVGDQVFTDVLGGKRAGLFTVLVTPLGRREFPATALVRVAERMWLRRLRSRGRCGHWSPCAFCRLLPPSGVAWPGGGMRTHRLSCRVRDEEPIRLQTVVERHTNHARIRPRYRGNQGVGRNAIEYEYPL